MRSELISDTGRILMVTEDYGDGTGTRTFYDENGNVTGTEHVADLPIIDPNATSEAEAVAKATALAMALLADPERFETLVAAVTNTAKAPLQYLNKAVQAAAVATPENNLSEDGGENV